MTIRTKSELGLMIELIILLTSVTKFKTGKSPKFFQHYKKSEALTLQ